MASDIQEKTARESGGVVRHNVNGQEAVTVVQLVPAWYVFSYKFGHNQLCWDKGHNEVFGPGQVVQTAWRAKKIIQFFGWLFGADHLRLGDQNYQACQETWNGRRPNHSRWYSTDLIAEISLPSKKPSTGKQLRAGSNLKSQ